MLHLKIPNAGLFSASLSCLTRSIKKTQKTITHRVHKNLGAMNIKPLKLKLLLACRKTNTLQVHIVMK